MRHLLAAVIVLCCTCCVPALGFCNKQGPGPCCHIRKTCDWTYTSGWIYEHSWTSCFLELEENPNTIERIESRQVCSTNNSVHCLRFRYEFDEDYVLNLTVFLKQDGMDKQEIWKIAHSDDWDNASVPVKTTADFKLIIEAKGPSEDIVSIDDISYSKTSCSIHPEDATPAPVTDSTMITSTPTPDLTSSSTAKPVTALPTSDLFTPAKSTAESFTALPSSDLSTTAESTAESSMIDPSEHTSDSTQADDGSTSPPLQAGRTAPEEPSGNIGLIVGVVVAVVLVLLIGLVLFVLFTRKQGHEWKMCFRRQKQKEEDFHVSSSHNQVYCLDETEPDQFFNVDTNPAGSENDIEQQGHPHTAAVVPCPANDGYSVIGAAASDFSIKEHKYDEVNTLKKFNNGKCQQDPEGSDESPYEIQDSSENTACVAQSPEDDYNRLNVHTRNHADHNDESVHSTNPTRDYNRLVLKTQAQPSTARSEEERGLSQNSANTFQTPKQKASQSLYQNVGSAETHRFQQGPGLTSLPQQDSDLTREDASADVYTLPTGTASTLQPFTQQEDPTVPESHCLDEENNTYQVLEEAPSSYPDTCDKAEEDYSHLDLERSRNTEVKGEGEPAAVYNRLKEGEEGHYDRMDRGGRKEVLDGDYSHI